MSVLTNEKELMIDKMKEWGTIVTDNETAKKYLARILDFDKALLLFGIKEEYFEPFMIKNYFKYGYRVFIYAQMSPENHGKLFSLLLWLKKYEIKVEAIVSEESGEFEGDFNGVQVISEEELKRYVRGDKIVVLPVVQRYNEIRSPYQFYEIPFFYLMKRRTIKRKLTKKVEKIFGGFALEIIYPFYKMAELNGHLNFDLMYRQYFYVQNKSRVFEALEGLDDVESKSTLCEYMRCIFYNDVYRLPEYPSADKYFGQGLFENASNEYFLNCGSCQGDTVFYFLDKYKEFGKVYAVEGNPKLADCLRKNLDILPVEVRKQIEIYNMFIGDNDDTKNVFRDKRITLINMDIEGAELSVLRSLEGIIRKQLPILSICVYHKSEDIWEIPQFIRSCSSEYNFFIRKYASSITLYNSSAELVLYAVPTYRLRV